MLQLGLYAEPAVVICTAMVGAVVVWDIVVYLNGTCSVGGAWIGLCQIVVLSLCSSSLRSSLVSDWCSLRGLSGSSSYWSTSGTLLPW